MKYIVYKTTEGEVPVIFPNRLAHKELAALVPAQDIVSAGSVRFGPHGAALECFGKSTSLNVKSREKHDSILINHYMKTS